MKKRRLIIVLAAIGFLTAITVRAQDSAVIHMTFVMHSPGLAGNSTVYITGGTDQLGNWDPGKVKMKYIGGHKWSKTIALSTPGSLEYKYTLGSWDREGAGTDGSALPNLMVEILGDTVIHNEIGAWTNKKPVAVAPSVTGTVRFHRGMKGEGLKDRDVVVWLPPGYYSEPERQYPVLYLHDGQNVFDAATSAYGTEWRVDETLDSMIRAGAIPPVIAVGVYNTPDRGEEYSPGVFGNAYMEFMVNRLKPFIDSSYRTLPGPEHTITCGASSGGTIAFMLAWEHPGVFMKAICMSPAFQFGSMDYVSTAADYQGPPKDILIFIYNGGVGLETKLQPGIDRMLGTLTQKGYREGKNFIFVSDPAEKHFESAWAKHFPEAIRWCLGGK